MKFLRSAIAVTFAATLPLVAQSPRAFLKFDGNLADSSGAGIVTGVTISSGFTPTYVADRNGVANKAIQFPAGGAASLKLVSANDTNLTLGLRSAALPNTTSFTLMAWINVDSVTNQGYNTVFGNSGSGAGTLHVGLNNNSDKTHFGFDGNDLNGGASGMVPGVWYHVAWVYDTTATNGQRIYVNGIPDATRTGVTNTLNSGNVYIGNWGSSTSNANDFRGRMDDVAIYDKALKGDQILAIFNGTPPDAVPAAGTYFAPRTLYGYRGSAGNWGVREIKGYPGINYNSLVDVDRILKANATTPGGTLASYLTTVLNAIDDEGAGATGYFANEGDLGTNTAGPDDSILMLARCTVKIPTAGDYTFGFCGDDGSRLRVLGRPFTSSTRIATANIADPAHIGDTLYFPAGTGNSATLGVVNLPAGDVDLEYTWWENTGGASLEVFASPGSLTSVGSTFQLIGNTAAGGLEIVRDSTTAPTLTVNGNSSLSVVNGAPSTFTLAWSVTNPTTVLSINQGIGAVAQTGALVLPSPAVSTIYTITATTGSDVVTESVNVYVVTAPVVSLSATDTTVTSGSALTLNWTSVGATSLILNPGNVNVFGQTSLVVNPLVTTTYKVTATNAYGTAESSITVVVGAAPVISNFSATDVSPVYGKETTLAWTTLNATSVSMNQNVGTVPVSGSVTVVPLTTTTYTLTAVNDFASVSGSVAITMPTPIGVNASGFAVRRVSATTPFPFTGQSYLESAVSLLGGRNAGVTTSQGGYTTINFNDGADGDFTTGNNAFPGGGGDHFAVEITATLVVNVPGEYDFIVNCDDGCRLRIDGKDVIVDDANHSPTASSGRFIFDKPTAQLELIYYDAIGGASCELAWIRPNLSWQLLGVVTPAAPIVRGGLVISEFAASGSTLKDEDGTAQDWIEIWNSSTSPVDLAGHYLSTSAATPAQWEFPNRVLAPDEYLVVFASEKNRADPLLPLHTNFKLPAAASYLSLKRADGSGGFITLTEFAPYPAQTPGTSYGSSDSEGYVGFIETPTPGAPNAASYIGFLGDVSFSAPRGRYSTAFNLTLASTTPGAEIRYTVDGSPPTPNHGAVYTAPLPINATTNLRAAAFLAGWKPSSVITHSYLFVDDIVNQTTAYATSRGWPAAPVNGQVYKYGLSLANVTAGGGDLSALKSALAAAPSVCMNLDPAAFHGVSTGIYSNPAKRGRFWEREASLEIINADGTSAVQKDCGVRIRGNASRAVTNPKHAFHLYFRSLYAGDLVHPIFGNEGAVTRFDQIDMRCEENNSWSKDNSVLNAMIREEFSRKTQGDQGQPYSRSSFFHLYINGIYWGVFNWEEKTEADYAANQFGGSDSDYDTVKSAGNTGGYNTEMTDGNFIAWQQLFDLALALKAETTEAGRTARYMQMMGLNPDGSRNPAYPVLLDVDNLVDYQINLFYTGGFDGPVSWFLKNASNNWFGIRRRDGNRGFMFFSHDNEHSMGTTNNSYNRVGPWGDPNPATLGNNWGQTWTTTQYHSRDKFIKFNPEYLHENLAFSAEYRMRFMDRVQKNFFGNGPLTRTAALARMNGIAAQVDPIIHAEAARWGNTTHHKGTWLGTGKAGVESFITTGGPTLAGQTVWPAQSRELLMIEQFKGYTDDGPKPLASSLGAPVFTGQPGGNVPASYSFDITHANPSGIIHYTTDGKDPRSIGGGISSTASSGPGPITVTLTHATTVKARVYLSATDQWSALTESSYIVAAIPASAANIVISKLHYNPIGGAVPTSAEFLEIMNISDSTVNLDGCKFTLGVTFSFDFPEGYLLQPGARCLLVENQSAFIAAFPAVDVSLIAGTYSGNLNNGGERLTFLAKDNIPIKDFTYDDVAPWPGIADGAGPSLVLISPEMNCDHGIAANWRASATYGGSPGAADAPSYSAWQETYQLGDSTGTGDFDHDGLPNLIEYSLGRNPTTPNSSGLVPGDAIIEGLPYLTLTCVRQLGLDEISFSVESSASLAGIWLPAVLVSSTPDYLTGTLTEIYRHPDTRQGADRQFLRARVIRLP